MGQTKIPNELRDIIGSEKIDFITKSKWNHPRAKGFSILILSFFLSITSVIFINKSIVPLAFGHKINVNGKLVGIENIGDKGMIIFLSLIGFCVIISILLSISTYKIFFQKGAYFVGTKTRLIKFRNSVATVKEWDDFTERISINSKNNSYGNLTFVLKTGRMVSRGGDETGGGIRFFRPDFIYIIGTFNIYEIERKCRTRIMEIKSLANKTSYEKP